MNINLLSLYINFSISSLVLTNHILASWTKMFRVLHAVHAAGNTGAETRLETAQGHDDRPGRQA